MTIYSCCLSVSNPISISPPSSCRFFNLQMCSVHSAIDRLSNSITHSNGIGAQITIRISSFISPRLVDPVLWPPLLHVDLVIMSINRILIVPLIRYDGISWVAVPGLIFVLLWSGDTIRPSNDDDNRKSCFSRWEGREPKEPFEGF